MKQKTAIRQAIELLEYLRDKRLYLGDDVKQINASILIVKAMEPVNEQQIAEAHEQGYDDYQYGQRNGKEYFNETFES